MNKKTHDKLIKDALSYIHHKFGDTKPSHIALIKQIDEDAYKMQPGSWSNLKRAISALAVEHHHLKLAADVRSLRNQAVLNKSVPKIQKKVKKLSLKDTRLIVNAVAQNSTNELKAAVFLSYHLGARPSELKTITPLSSDRFKIITSKKDSKGKRGIDRIIIITDEKIAKQIPASISKLKNAKIKHLQDNFAYRMKKLFPRRKKRPTLYTFRHQLASDYKSEGYSKEAIAYLLGHQSTRTQENYGNKRSGGSRKIAMEASINDEELSTLIRDSHSIRESKMHERLGIKSSSQLLT